MLSTSAYLEEICYLPTADGGSPAFLKTPLLRDNLIALRRLSLVNKMCNMLLEDIVFRRCAKAKRSLNLAIYEMETMQLEGPAFLAKKAIKDNNLTALKFLYAQYPHERLQKHYFLDQFGEDILDYAARPGVHHKILEWVLRNGDYTVDRCLRIGIQVAGVGKSVKKLHMFDSYVGLTKELLINGRGSYLGSIMEFAAMGCNTLNWIAERYDFDENDLVYIFAYTLLSRDGRARKYALQRWGERVGSGVGLKKIKRHYGMLSALPAMAMDNKFSARLEWCYRRMECNGDFRTEPKSAIGQKILLMGFQLAVVSQQNCWRCIDWLFDKLRGLVCWESWPRSQFEVSAAKESCFEILARTAVFKNVRHVIRRYKIPIEMVFKTGSSPLYWALVGGKRKLLFFYLMYYRFWKDDMSEYVRIAASVVKDALPLMNRADKSVLCLEMTFGLCYFGLTEGIEIFYKAIRSKPVIWIRRIACYFQITAEVIRERGCLAVFLAIVNNRVDVLEWLAREIGLTASDAMHKNGRFLGFARDEKRIDHLRDVFRTEWGIEL